MQTKNSKVEAKAVRYSFIGYRIMIENTKCMMAYTIVPCNSWRIGTVIDTVSF